MESKRSFFILLILAIAYGIALAIVDTRPHWDDTGISAVALLTGCGLLGLVHPSRPWIWALAVGIWIPLFNIILNGNVSVVFVLLIALIAAYAGSFAGRLLRHTGETI